MSVAMPAQQLETFCISVFALLSPCNSAAMKLRAQTTIHLDRVEAHSCNCVTTQMTLDARGTGMTLTGSERPSRLAKLTFGILRVLAFIAVAMQ
jgi:hypothetical protein